MGLDITMHKLKYVAVFDANITHNLTSMAKEANIYDCLWRANDLRMNKASDLIAPLKQGLAAMKADPARFRAFDSPNAWGTYNDFVPWLEKLIKACEKYPDADIQISR